MAAYSHQFCTEQGGYNASPDDMQVTCVLQLWKHPRSLYCTCTSPSPSNRVVHPFPTSGFTADPTSDCISATASRPGALDSRQHLVQYLIASNKLLPSKHLCPSRLCPHIQLKDVKGFVLGPFGHWRIGNLKQPRVRRLRLCVKGQVLGTSDRDIRSRSSYSGHIVVSPQPNSCTSCMYSRSLALSL